MRRKQIILATISICEIENRDKIDTIVLSADSVRGTYLLNVAPSHEQGRTIIVLAGNSEGVMEAAYKIAEKALSILNIRKRSPRIGVLDTVFFTPIQGCTFEDCKRLAKKFGKKIYQDFQVPFFYHNYKNYALYLELVSLLMKRGIRGLRERIQSGILKPTLGGIDLSEKSGFLFTFARTPTIHLIVNISTFDPDISFRVAQRLDCSTHAKLWSAGTTVKGEGGQSFIIPEKYSGVKALGITNEYVKTQQINVLIHDTDKVMLHEIYEAIKYEADYFGSEIVSCEIFGLLPKKPLLQSGQFYTKKELGEKELIDLAVKKLQLSDNSIFVPEVKIIEYLIEGKW